MAVNNPDIETELKTLASGNLLRRLRNQQSRGVTRALIDGCEAVLFAGNDYLGLSAHPRVLAAARRALERYGSSAGASRLVTGNHPLFQSLEENLARFKGKEAALVFPSGYMANLGFLAAMAGPDDLVFSDRLCHASLYDGLRLSGARFRRYRHNDAGHLGRLLSREDPKGRLLIVTDGIFSMDGDLAPLPEIRVLADRHGCLLAVDDAHGTGVIGPGGRGTATLLGVKPEIETGTLSKAAGSLGGFVAGSRELVDYLVNKARPFIFTTGLPPASVAAADAALGLFEEEGWRRERVLKLAARARLVLGRAGFRIPGNGVGPNRAETFSETPATPIVPLITGDEKLALRLSSLCLNRGIFIPAIRNPAVPKNQARLRMTLSAAHSDEELNRALEVLTESGGELGLI
ncbi:MAG: 8-amino-7-oxononanoate synthase [Thermoleophilia bacterium]|nr:8-amino-7-oxononanoate synthase [Thermoleophilia bacterium]